MNFGCDNTLIKNKVRARAYVFTAQCSSYSTVTLEGDKHNAFSVTTQVRLIHIRRMALMFLMLSRPSKLFPLSLSSSCLVSQNKKGSIRR